MGRPKKKAGVYNISCSLLFKSGEHMINYIFKNYYTKMINHRLPLSMSNDWDQTNMDVILIVDSDPIGLGPAKSSSNRSG